ncbi:DUF4174 domain-containing protein [Prolixibacter sp. NT017]|uniref:DUF4174 domain-containing protein n=1 Tax=Prolixibacter sp. NT017 TaxID=2652390 RepID=UPI001271DD84|nr:DUF4174 domain-containing protein [Prolixibacter sp. NT017]GET25365.1 hypothetical protein NT017_16940 [Prolixibacter sp. NT017]
MPNKPFLLLLAFTVFFIFRPSTTVASNPLKPYLWKNVVVLYQLKADPVKEESAFQQTIDKNFQRFKQDKLVFIDLTGKNTGKLHAQLTPEALETIRKRFKTEANQSMYIIVGMDGWEKFRQTGRFNPSEFIDIIMQYSSSNSEK